MFHCAYLLTLYCARPPFPQLRCGLILMQKLALIIAPQIEEQNKNVLVCAGLLVSYTLPVCLRTMGGEWTMILRIPDNA